MEILSSFAISKTILAILSFVLLSNIPSQTQGYLLPKQKSAQYNISTLQAQQGGEIGLALSSGRYVPYSSKSEDVAATQRLMDFYWGWILDPVFYGDYPTIMKEYVGNRLPKFTKKEKYMLKGSTDFVGINYYTSRFARHESNRTKIMYDNYDALVVSEASNIDGKILGYKDQYGWNNVYPEGLYNFLVYIKEKYKNPKIYITENGIASSKISNPLKDEHRIAYVAAHLNATKAAIDDGVNVQGYFLWAAFDTFEFQAGYSGNWGLYHIDFNDTLKRIPTDAAKCSTVDDQPNPKSPMSHSSLVPSFSQHTSHMSQSTQPGPPPLNTLVRPNLQLNIQPNF
ncbi:hypothetical protein KIW84_035928 [Lathyrus oleraceus]|uniref:Uncharacterized protein n=1 Tax=Pisum sativum TaxID=3888 RepID=A0A9D5B6C9_PEA|nr:hypothetical protein KIW84_035928 [Pisum sativum]